MLKDARFAPQSSARIGGTLYMLIIAAGPLPRALGVLMAIAGVSYLTLSTARLLSPRLASMLFPSILVPALIGELSFAVWLTVKGVNVARWQEQTGHPTASL